MSDFGDLVDGKLAGQTEFFRAWMHLIERNLIDLDPWALYTFSEQIAVRSRAVNARYSGREVLCFAERRDTDDVSCIVLGSDASEYPVGQVLIVHDFAKSGSEVDASYPDFWGWFRAAVDDLIDVFCHWVEHQ